MEKYYESYENFFGKEAAQEMAELYSIFGVDTLEWAARLFDYEVGGFYYSNSARDTDGYLPDVESTTQALGLLGASDLSKYGSIAAAVPEEMGAAIVRFVSGLQDPDDGYFYHPQWGKSVNTSRTGRDLDSSCGLLRRFGSAPPYDTPIERGKKGDNSSLPEHLRSWEALEAWLEGLGLNEYHKSYSCAHTISSIRSQIAAAGYTDRAVEWINSKQKENGLWEDGELDYAKFNGLLKICTCHETWNKPYPRLAQGVQACIDAALSDELVCAVPDVYNPWVALGILLPNAKAHGAPGEYEAALEKLKVNAASLIRKTKEKLLLFRKEDGSFSYFKDRSSALSQGVPAAVPNTNEGDVNATALAVGTASHHIAKAFGIKSERVFSAEDLEAFLAIVRR